MVPFQETLLFFLPGPADSINLFKSLALNQGCNIFIDGQEGIRSPPIGSHPIGVGALGAKRSAIDRKMVASCWLCLSS